MNAQTKITEHIVDFLIATPKAMAVLIASFLSGHLWLFIIKAFRKRTVGHKYFESKTGRVAIGALWMCTILVFVYAIKYENFFFEYEKILDVSITTIITAFFIQLILFVLFLIFGDK